MHKHQSHMCADTYNGHLRRRSCQRKRAHDRLYFKSSNAQDHVPQNLGSLNHIFWFIPNPHLVLIGMRVNIRYFDSNWSLYKVKCAREIYSEFIDSIVGNPPGSSRGIWSFENNSLVGAKLFAIFLGGQVYIGGAQIFRGGKSNPCLYFQLFKFQLSEFLIWCAIMDYSLKGLSRPQIIKPIWNITNFPSVL